KHERLSVQIDSGDRIEMERGQDGVFTAASRGASAGTRYQFRTTDGRLLPDPATRYQPEGPHGPSQVVDATTFAWSDADWRGPDAGRHVVYEMHIGTFTQEGTWDAAARRLEDLADLGVTIIEVMPVAEFAGRFNWGYDGVAPFAP